METFDHSSLSPQEAYFLRIPVQLCLLALKEKAVRLVQLYCYLKCNCDGKLNSKDLDRIIKDQRIMSEKTALKHLDTLLARNWLGYNRKTDAYYIRGFEKIRQIEGLTLRIAVIYDEQDICYERFKSFVSGAIIANLIRIQKRKRGPFLRSYIRGRSFHKKRYPSFPVANLAISECYGFGKSKACRIKKSAAEYGYIRVQHNYVVVSSSIAFIDEFRAANPELARRVVNHNGQVAIQKPDLINSDMRFSRRKKVKP